MSRAPRCDPNLLRFWEDEEELLLFGRLGFGVEMHCETV